MDDKELHNWFLTVVLPLEGSLLSYLRRHWKAQDEVRDLLHDVYERAILGAGKGLPQQGRAYVFTIARNLLINRSKLASVVSLDLIANIENFHELSDELSPERHTSGREDLQRAIDGMQRLPPRCREVVRLRKIEGLSTKEVAQRLSIGIDAVERQMTLGMRALTDFMLGGSGRVQRKRYGTIARLRKGLHRD